MIIYPIHFFVSKILICEIKTANRIYHSGMFNIQKRPQLNPDNGGRIIFRKDLIKVLSYNDEMNDRMIIIDNKNNII